MTEQPTLTTSTGKNDTSSPYGFNFSNISSLFTSLAGTAGSTYASLNQTSAEKAKVKAAQQLAAAQAASAQQTSSSTMRMIVLGIVAVVVVFVVVVIFRKRKG